MKVKYYLLRQPTCWTTCLCGYSTEDALLPLAFHIGELRNEVSNYLSLYGTMWVVLYIEFT